MIDKEIFKELLREAFQDFDLLDYNYSIDFRLGVLETNKDGSIKEGGTRRRPTLPVSYNNYITLFRESKNDIVTYKDYIIIHYHFNPKGVVNKKEFDEFFLDGMIKLNYFLKEYGIEIPIKKINYNKNYSQFSKSIEILGKEREIVVEFSSRLKEK